MSASTRRFIALAHRLNAAVDNAPGINRHRMRSLLAQELRIIHRSRGRQCHWGPREVFATVVNRIVSGITLWASLAPQPLLNA
jgi:hypothetical protein